MFEAAKGSPWACTGLYDHSASELPDGEQKLTARRWTNVSELVRYRFRDNRAADSAVLCTQLVLRCANALNRSQNNLHVYVSDTSVSLQFAALGTENVAEVLRLSEQSLPLSDEDSAKLLGMVNPAIQSPKLHGNNGAKAGLSVLRWLAGPVAKATKAAPVRRVNKSARSGTDRSARARGTSGWEDAYTSAAAGERAADLDLGGASSTVSQVYTRCAAATPAMEQTKTCGAHNGQGLEHQDAGVSPVACATAERKKWFLAHLPVNHLKRTT